LILDEPTNDLDIVTLNILEEFLEGYQGCMLMVTHDRYFMDRLVDHVFVLDGTGDVKDIHGNYTDYRSIFDQGGKKQEIPKQIEEKVVVKQEAPAKKKTKLSFKEQHELDTIEKELAKLEEEKKKLVERMNDTSLSHDELAKAAIDYQKTEEKIDEKTMRWLELQE
jgi:ATP-binding cassette subfamily F protein uup